MARKITFESNASLMEEVQQALCFDSISPSVTRSKSAAHGVNNLLYVDLLPHGSKHKPRISKNPRDKKVYLTEEVSFENEDVSTFAAQEIPEQKIVSSQKDCLGTLALRPNTGVPVFNTTLGAPGNSKKKHERNASINSHLHKKDGFCPKTFFVEKNGEVVKKTIFICREKCTFNLHKIRNEKEIRLARKISLQESYLYAHLI